jgi:hypothetical protein
LLAGTTYKGGSGGGGGGGGLGGGGLGGGGLGGGLGGGGLGAVTIAPSGSVVLATVVVVVVSIATVVVVVAAVVVVVTGFRMPLRLTHSRACALAERIAVAFVKTPKFGRLAGVPSALVIAFTSYVILAWRLPLFIAMVTRCARSSLSDIDVNNSKSTRTPLVVARRTLRALFEFLSGVTPLIKTS